MNLIVAACENMGIGIDGKLPWRLKSEMAYFTRMTTRTKDINKKNVVLMGRNTWDCIPLKYRPLPNRINVVLSRNSEFKVDDESVLVSDGLDAAVALLSQPNMRDNIENVWVIGGSHIYKDVMESKYFHRLYLTEILAKFECDTFMPPLGEHLTLIEDPEVSADVNEENGIKFIYRVYENSKKWIEKV
ncbi:Dihydrofolate reductase [Carabus blaptoides fortunei]